MNILAIDLGKFNSMCCFFDTDTQEYRFQSAATTRSYLTAVLKNHEIDLVVMEACGPSGWINDLCQEHGIKTLVGSTNEEAWRWSNVKRKTDKDDALKLARLAMRKQRKPVHVPRHEVREHRTLAELLRNQDAINGTCSVPVRGTSCGLPSFGSFSSFRVPDPPNDDSPEFGPFAHELKNQILANSATKCMLSTPQPAGASGQAESF